MAVVAVAAASVVVLGLEGAQCTHQVEQAAAAVVLVVAVAVASAVVLGLLPLLAARFGLGMTPSEMGLRTGRWRRGLFWLAVGLPLAVLAGGREPLAALTAHFGQGAPLFLRALLMGLGAAALVVGLS